MVVHVIFTSWECSRLDEPFCSVDEEYSIEHDIDFASPVEKLYDEIFSECLDKSVDEMDEADEEICNRAMFVLGILEENVRIAARGNHRTLQDVLKMDLVEDNP